MKNSDNPFKERSLSVAGDYSKDELLFLYSMGKELKEAWHDNSINRQEKLSKFRINNPHLKEYLNPDFGVYDAFFEPSTRTDHSSKNAAKFHFVKHLSFVPERSSLSKEESYADTFMTLAGYYNQIFIVRTTLEGVCRWLDIKGEEFFQEGKLPFKPAFINAGDGKHEHPTQELLDEFTFLEDNDWKNDYIHVALIGDLLHGRTVHSKVFGLQVFNNVKVDLVAPSEIQMPNHYIKQMEDRGYEIKKYESLQEYYKSGAMATKQYFTRPQLERMGDEILKKQHILRDKIIFKKEYLNIIPKNTAFYHPFPRHREYPTIPEFLDTTKLNHYSKQSDNGMIMRIILLSAIAGKIGWDFKGETLRKNSSKEYDFVKDITSKYSSEKQTTTNSKKKILKQGVNPLTNGVVIDHVCKGETPEKIWDYLHKVMNIMDFNKKNGSCHVGESKKDNTYKGLIFLPGLKGLSDSSLRRLAAITGSCTVNKISDNKLERKMRLSIPPRIYKISGTGCKNENCISHHKHLQHVPTEFNTKSNKILTCAYCDTEHQFKDVWLY